MPIFSSVNGMRTLRCPWNKASCLFTNVSHNIKTICSSENTPFSQPAWLKPEDDPRATYQMPYKIFIIFLGGTMHFDKARYSCKAFHNKSPVSSVHRNTISNLKLVHDMLISVKSVCNGSGSKQAAIESPLMLLCFWTSLSLLRNIVKDALAG